MARASMAGLLPDVGRDRATRDAASPPVFFTETKSGMPIYNGTTAEYEEWLFRVRGKHRRAQNDEERRDVVNKIVEGLRDGALRVAMDIGYDQLEELDGFEQLIQAMEALVRPLRSLEAKELYHLGVRPRGKLSRQPTEPMVDYILR